MYNGKMLLSKIDLLIIDTSICFKVAEKLNLKCSHHKKEMIIMEYDGYKI